MHIRYRVKLNESERAQLEAMVGGGRHAVRRVKRAQILFGADRGVSDADMAATLRVGTSTGLSHQAALRGARTGARPVRGLASGRPAQAGGRGGSAVDRDRLFATASRTSTLDLGPARLDPRAADDPPDDLARHDWPPPRGYGPQTVAGKDVVHPAIDPSYVAGMENVLELYTTLPRPGTAVVCVDEPPQQL